MSLTLATPTVPPVADAWSNQTLTLTPTPGLPDVVGGFHLWVYPEACGDPGDPVCVPVAQPVKAGALFKKVVLTVEDPTGPVLGAITGLPPVLPGTSTVWTNAKSLVLSATAAGDAESGVKVVSINTEGKEKRRLVVGKGVNDAVNKTSRAAGTPPLASPVPAPRTVSFKEGTYRLWVSATNGADMASTTSKVTLGVDRKKPTYVVKTGQVAVRDASSGLASGKVVVDGNVVSLAPECVGRRSCSVKLKGDPGQQAVLTAIDRAGNILTDTFKTKGRAAKAGRSVAGVRILNDKEFANPVGVDHAIKLLLTGPTSDPVSLQAFRGSKITNAKAIYERQITVTKQGTKVNVSLEALGLGPDAKSGQYDLTFALATSANNADKPTRKARTARRHVIADRDGPAAIAFSPDSVEGREVGKTANVAIDRPKKNKKDKHKVEVRIGKLAKDRPDGKVASRVDHYTFQLVDTGGYAQLGNPVEKTPKQLKGGKPFTMSWKTGAGAVLVYATDNAKNTGATRSLPIPGAVPAPLLDNEKREFIYGLQLPTGVDFDDPYTGGRALRLFGLPPSAAAGPASPAESSPDPAELDALQDAPSGVVDASSTFNASTKQPTSTPMRMLRHIAPIDVWAGSKTENYYLQTTATIANAEELRNRSGKQIDVMFSLMPHGFLVDKECPDVATKKVKDGKEVVGHSSVGSAELVSASKGSLVTLDQLPDPSPRDTVKLPAECRLPTPSLYRRYVEQWINNIRGLTAKIKDVSGGPGVRVYLGAWNEPDEPGFGLVRLKNGPKESAGRMVGRLAAQYWIEAKAAMKKAQAGGCRVCADVVIGEFSQSDGKSQGAVEGLVFALKKEKARPKRWGIHNYSDLLPEIRPMLYVVPTTKSESGLRTSTLQGYTRLVDDGMGASDKFEYWDTETGVRLNGPAAEGDVKGTTGDSKGGVDAAPYTPLANRPAEAYRVGQRFGKMRLWDRRVTRAVYYGLLAGGEPRRWKEGKFVVDPTQLKFDSSLLTYSRNARPAYCALLGLPENSPACVWTVWDDGLPG